VFLPFRDAPNPPGTPYVTWALIAANVLVFALLTLPLSLQGVDLRQPEVLEAVRAHPWLAQALRGQGGLSGYDLFLAEWAYVPAEGRVVTMFSSMFLHGGFMHLAGNMLFLWIYGDNVEARLGPVPYLLTYLATGVCATLGHGALAAGSIAPTVGASGAISGVLGLYFVLFPRNVVYVFLFLFPFFATTVQVPARVVLGFYVVVQNLLPLALAGGGGGGGVAYGAHIGGFAAGLLGAFAMNATDRRGAPSRAPAPARGAPPSEVATLVRAGRHADAAQAWFASDPPPRLPHHVALELGVWLAEAGHPNAALQLFRRTIADAPPRGAEAAWGHVGAGLVGARYLGRHTAAAQHFLDAIDLDPGGPAGARARRALDELGDGA